MAPSRLLFCAASLALLDFKTFAKAASTTVKFGEEVKDCLASLNVARQAADLGNLTSEGNVQDALQDSGSLGQPICDAVEGKEVSTDKKEDLKTNGTFAVFALAGENTTPDCNAAVKSWQDGFSIFEQTAPANSKIDDYIKDPKAMSFLTLYNPRAGKGLCKVVTCTPTSREANKKSALVCLTSPSVITDTAMFSDDQWEKIVKVFSSSAFVAVPSLLAIAAVLAGASLL
ncbi:hypothetical protein Emag_004127 [Eimeria magna]